MRLPILLCLGLAAVLPAEAATLSQGPLLGGVTEQFAGIWLRTDAPARVEVQLQGPGKPLTQSGQTTEQGNRSYIARFENLQPDQAYHYRVLVDGQLQFQTNFVTPGPKTAARPVRLVYASCFALNHALSGATNEFMKMNERNADLVMFLGDFPYTIAGRLAELRQQHARIRSRPWFRELTSARPVYAIWDDHDFGPNDADGTHPHAAEAFAGFKEHWPSQSYGLPEVPGIFSKVTFGDIDFFRLDCRFHSRRSPDRKIMLGKEQFAWLCRELKQSQARYKVICSGPQIWRNKSDSWGGDNHRAERDRLLHFLRDEKITGALFISGDVHRSNIHRSRLPDGRYLYDFTSSPLAQATRVSPVEADWPPEMIFSHPEKHQFSELEFRPASDKETAVIYRVISVKNGLVQKFVVPPAELGL